MNVALNNLMSIGNQISSCQYDWWMDTGQRRCSPWLFDQIMDFPVDNLCSCDGLDLMIKHRVKGKCALNSTYRMYTLVKWIHFFLKWAAIFLICIYQNICFQKANSDIYVVKDFKILILQSIHVTQFRSCVKQALGNIWHWNDYSRALTWALSQNEHHLSRYMASHHQDRRVMRPSHLIMGIPILVRYFHCIALQNLNSHKAPNISP